MNRKSANASDKHTCHTRFPASTKLQRDIHICPNSCYKTRGKFADNAPGNGSRSRCPAAAACNYMSALEHAPMQTPCHVYNMQKVLQTDNHRRQLSFAQVKSGICCTRRCCYAAPAL